VCDDEEAAARPPSCHLQCPRHAKSG
jgi:uncharacterized damage-inducible protein DinB